MKQLLYFVVEVNQRKYYKGPSNLRLNIKYNSAVAHQSLSFNFCLFLNIIATASPTCQLIHEYQMPAGMLSQVKSAPYLVKHFTSSSVA